MDVPAGLKITSSDDAPPGVINFIPSGPTDAQLAEEYRERMNKALFEVLNIINEARRQGIVINFQLGEDGFGRQAVGALHILKKL